jgi:hypothetical protein
MGRVKGLHNDIEQSPSNSSKSQVYLRKAQQTLMKLTDFEVFVQMLKFMVGIGIFHRAKIYQQYGLAYGLVSDLLGMVMVNVSNSNLVRCLQFMPKTHTSPGSMLTYGKVVNYCLDQRDSRLDAKTTRVSQDDI